MYHIATLLTIKAAIAEHLEYLTMKIRGLMNPFFLGKTNTKVFF